MPVARASREVHDVIRAATPTHASLRARVAALALATAVIDAVGSVLILLLERDERGTEITNLGDSVFWTTAQLLTVSSQMRNPLSTGGRILDLFFEAWAISAVAVLAGSFGAFFHRRGQERHAEAG
jgi:hypothetical protein